MQKAIAAICFLALLLSLTSPAAAEEDLYEILGLGAEREEATEKDIKRQFRLLSKQYHPDLTQGDEAKKMYQKINRANEILSDKRKRKMYDMRGEEGLKQLEKSSQQQNHGHNDIFASFFGGGGGQQTKGQNAQMNMEFSLEDFYNGRVHKLELSKQKLCKRCKGTGAASGSDFAKCRHCGGQGQVVQKIQLAPGFIQQVQQPCGHCGGTGKTVKNKCPTCKGAKVGKGTSTIELDLERGMKEGHQIVFEMEADQSPDLIPGDVIIAVRSRKHDVFTRRDDIHLEMTLKLTLKEALLGFRRSVTHMDGHVFEISRNEITPYGTQVVLRGEGMPKHGVPSEKGDLTVTLVFELPSRLTEQQADGVKEIFSI
jgi:DnaJ-related protein SCJ1